MQNAGIKGIGREYIRFVVPSVIAMMISSVYIIIDGVFVGQGIGETALAAVNIVFPFIFLTMALTLLIAIGGANVYSFYKGSGDMAKANNVFCQCVALLIALGLLLGIPSFVFRRELGLLLGANSDILPYVTAFLAWAAPLQLLQSLTLGVSVFIRNDDAPGLVMAGTIAGSLVNVVLEYIFIMRLHKGIEYTVIANNIAMLVQGLIFAARFVFRKGQLTLALPRFRGFDLKRIFANGVSTFLMELSQSTVAYSFNLALIHSHGTQGVASYAIVTYICAIVYSVMIGVSQGAQPLMSRSHGGGDEKTVYRVYKMGVRTNIAASTAFLILCLILGKGMAALFQSGNSGLTDSAAHMLRLFTPGYIMIGLTLMNILYFQTTERDRYSTVVALLRCVGFVQVLLLILVPLVGGNGIYPAFIGGEACNAVLSFVFVRRAVRRSIPAGEIA
ncbi:Na+-driven multidrug efflux pump [Sporobacter termitidis DSM 10068]|uniref:Na+-driven multidrug efflux pump n=1 Tax=Sporobacter termitidis DSM 10068 TaxID=1123282 RepID=A0A1M5Y4Z8_9FIRM|nr:MATE family efflux transporter [Sporobacter termitidis]SHI07150.1 Na+-driven multidrug efflux pump [Sporobacter termitidis DSM 10068]